MDFKLKSTIDDYAKDGGPGKVWLICSFYHDPLRPCLFCLVRYKALSINFLFDTHMSSGSEVINTSNNLSAQRIMVKTT